MRAEQVAGPPALYVAKRLVPDMRWDVMRYGRGNDLDQR